MFGNIKNYSYIVLYKLTNKQKQKKDDKKRSSNHYEKV